MKRDKVLRAIVGSALACCLTTAAQEKGNWRAASSTAQSITGDVALSTDKLFINFSGFAIAQIRSLAPGEVNAVFEDSGAGGGGNLYRLCGGEDTQWMAAYVTGQSLHLAFFSGQKAPVLTPDAIANSTDLCGTFSYVR
jgi:hypothetical protein